MIKLRPFQRDGCRSIYRFGGRVLLADDQGLGKTIQALYWITHISARPVVIVTPSSVKYNWQSEARDHFHLRTEVIEGHYQGRPRVLGSIVIINYDILSSWLPLLRPQVVILDECQYIKNLTALRTRAVRKLAQHARSVLALSGTPLTNRPIELWPVLSIVCPELFPNRMDFAWRYCRPRRTIWGWKFDGAERLPELNRLLTQNCMIRRLKKEVAPELPDKIHKVIPFRVNAAGYTEYHKAKNDFLHWLKGHSPTRAQKAKRNQALVKVGYLIRLCARLRLDWTTKWIEEFAQTHPDQKLVGLTMHTFVIEHLKAKFPNSIVIDGGVTGRKRHESVRLFQNNPKVRFCWGNWKAAGVGLTLTASSTLASLDFPWTPGDLLQGQDRIHRIGQTKKVIIYYLLMLGTIEETLMSGLKKKIGILEAVLNGEGRSHDFDIFDQLLEDMKNE